MAAPDRPYFECRSIDDILPHRYASNAVVYADPLPATGVLGQAQTYEALPVADIAGARFALAEPAAGMAQSQERYVLYSGLYDYLRAGRTMGDASHEAVSFVSRRIGAAFILSALGLSSAAAGQRLGRPAEAVNADLALYGRFIGATTMIGAIHQSFQQHVLTPQKRLRPNYSQLNPFERAGLLDLANGITPEQHARSLINEPNSKAIEIYAQLRRQKIVEATRKLGIHNVTAAALLLHLVTVQPAVTNQRSPSPNAASSHA